MKSKVLLPIMLVVFLAGSAAALGQDRNEKKINRIQRKIEKQSKKLQELTGEEFHASAEIAPPMNDEEIQKIKQEARAQAEQARAQAEQAREQVRESIQQLLEDKLKEKRDMEIDIQKNINGKKYHYYYKTPRFEFKGTDPIVIDVPKFKFKEGEPIVIDVPDIKIDRPESMGKAYGLFSGNQDNLSINKTLTEESSSADFNYEVKKGASGMSVHVNGAIDSGTVKITVKRPDGEVYNEYTLSSLASVNWKQTINFEDLKETEYLGKWTVTVTAEKARGNYSVQLTGR